MRFVFPVAVISALLLACPDAQAQEAVAVPLEIGRAGKAYLEVVDRRGVDTDVGYFDPTAAVPKLETELEPPPPPKPSAEGGSFWVGRLPLILLMLAILAGLVALILPNLGNLALSFEGEVENAGRGGRQRGGAAARGAEAVPADLQAIIRIADRRLALVMLARAALSRTIVANGVLPQPSWTLRDALRHIPKGQPHLDALRGLVLAGERVLFGNRDVTEDEFQAQVATIRPLMTGAGHG